MIFSGILRGLGMGTVWCYRALLWIAVAAVFILAATVLSLRYWILPNIENYREDIAQAVSKAVKQRVTIGGISASWDGLHPQLMLSQVTLHDQAGRPALTLQRIDSTLSWLSIPTLAARFHSLDFYSPSLDIRRDKNGVIFVAGMDVSGDRKEGGFSNWVLAQRDIEIHSGKIDWTDEMRDAPPLTLQGVYFQLVNRGERHRFGLKATPPAELAGLLDVRGDVHGVSLKTLFDWSGRLFVQLDYADLAAWQRWVPFPIELSRGAGALRAWATVDEHMLKEIVADVRLADVRTRLGKDVAELNLAHLTGRIGWKSSAQGFEVSTTQLAMTTTADLALPPTDFLLRVMHDKNGKPASGEVRANALNLAPVLSLFDHLPLDAAMRRRVAELAPRGRLYDVTAKWHGELPDPEEYSVRGRFEELAVNRYGAFPGLGGVSGNIDASQKGGSVQLNSRAVKLDMPQIFKEPLEFDSLVSQTGWTRDAKGFELKIATASYANSDLAGTLSGTYRSVPDQPGIIDLSGNLNRANALRAMRYFPVTVAKSSRPWMEGAFLAGTSNDVSFRVKGDLREFPFPDNKGGTFFVTAKVTGVELRYAENWPHIDNIDGDLAFRGKRMDIVARSGAIYGAKLSKVHAEIPDLKFGDQVLMVTGDAEGPTTDFFKFISTSPVAGYIDHFTDGMQAEGDGKLALRLELPLTQLEKSKVSGTYQLNSNKVVVDSTLPPLEQSSGRIEFTETGVNIPGVNATFFGGPISITGSTQRDSTIRIGLQGRVNPDAVRRAGGPAWLTYVRGSADWQGALTLRKKTADLVLESNLQGIASSLPAPLSKSATDAVPMRLERRFISNDRDQIALSYGDVVNARLLRRIEPKRTLIDRAVVRLGGGGAGEPERDGVWVSGTLKTANLDGWLKLAGGQGSSDIVYTIGGLDIKFDELDVFDRKLHELAVTATRQDNATQYTLTGREVEGRGTWNPQGKGRLTAELKKLIIPAGTPVGTVAEKTFTSDNPDLPALNIVAEQFQMGAKQLGKLELRATPQDRDWRIEQLRLSSNDSVLTVDGVWQSWLTNPRTNVNIRWDVQNIGSLLTRMGYADGVRRGSATLGGTLSWAGGPQQFDYASMSGNLVLQAVKGQFVKMEPGIAKLLGVLSLQSLPRRITLDFRDIFSDGFAFDEMLGTVKIERGVMATENFRINGPSARVMMAGSVDLARESQNLRVKVSPNISDSLSVVGGLAAGPIAFLAAFIAQKVLKDPFDDIVAFHYNVTGTWADPVVAKTDLPRRPEGPNTTID